MSEQLKVNKRSGRRLLDKLEDVLVGLGSRSDELTLENLEASGMFDKEQAEALRGFFAEMTERSKAYLLANPQYLEDGVRSGKITELQAAKVREELGLLENGGAKR
jgi:hypothetical protein